MHTLVECSNVAQTSEGDREQDGDRQGTETTRDDDGHETDKRLAGDWNSGPRTETDRKESPYFAYLTVNECVDKRLIANSAECELERECERGTSDWASGSEDLEERGWVGKRVYWLRKW